MLDQRAWRGSSRGIARNAARGRGGRRAVGGEGEKGLTVCWVRLECVPREEPLLEAWEGAYSSESVMVDAGEGG